MLTIGERIRFLRKRRNLTQDELAQLSGIHPVSIRKYETDKMQPQPIQIERIAEALHVNDYTISGFSFENLRLQTVGDLMGLLIVGHKSGLLKIRGYRREDGTLEPHTVHLCPNRVLDPYFIRAMRIQEEKVTYIENLGICIKNEAMRDSLIRWEAVYHKQQELDQKYSQKLENDPLNMFDKLQNEIERVEMEMQLSTTPL